MKQTHIKYLKRALNIAIGLNGVGDVKSIVDSLPSPSPIVYQLIRDICGDFRFYSVTENDSFWHRYALASVVMFIDSIPGPSWHDQDELGRLREDFIINWYYSFITPVSDFKKTQLEGELERKGWLKKVNMSKKDEEPDEDDEEDLPFDINEFSDEDYAPQYGHLPVEVQRYGRLNPQGESEINYTNVNYLQSIDPTLVELANRIGRSGSATSTEKGRFQHSSRSDISGITVGDDLNSLLPSELALLSMPATEDLFYRRYAQKRLQVFSSTSSSTQKGKKKCGPIIMCIDKSSSMSGRPESMAKSLALAIAIIAQRQRRPVCVINYSWDVSFIIIRNLQRQRQAFMSFLSQSYGGGNDENNLFNFIFKKLPKHPQFAKHADMFTNADLLVVSDYFWSPLDEDIHGLIARSRKNGMIYYALAVSSSIFLRQSNEEYLGLDFMMDGNEYFNNCDYRFTYQDGKCIELYETNKTEKK